MYHAHLMLNFGGDGMLILEEKAIFNFGLKKTPVYEVKLLTGANVENFIEAKCVPRVQKLPFHISPSQFMAH